MSSAAAVLNRLDPMRLIPMLLMPASARDLWLYRLGSTKAEEAAAAAEVRGKRAVAATEDDEDLMAAPVNAAALRAQPRTTPMDAIFVASLLPLLLLMVLPAPFFVLVS